MSHKATKIGLTCVVLVLAFGGLLYSTLSEGTEYYKHVDEVMANPGAWYGKNLQLHGFVQGEPSRKRDSLEYRFDVQNKGVIVRAYYTGIVPDTFKADSEVVLKGKLASDGTFRVEKDGVMAKCPSKYDPAKLPPAGAGPAATSTSGTKSSGPSGTR
jgi:cytochrome c-type biogenesis protein CcmE